MISMAQGNRRSAAGGGSSKPVSRKAPKQRIRSIRCLVRADGVSLLGLSTRQEPPSAVALRNAPAGAALCAPAVFAPRFARLRGIACWWWGRVAGPNHSPPVRRREGRGTASLSAPAVFCIALCAIARHSRAGKKNGSRQGQRLPGAMLPFRFLTP